MDPLHELRGHAIPTGTGLNQGTQCSVKGCGNFAVLLSAWLVASAPGVAGTIGSTPLPPQFSVSGFGSANAYQGQTFRLPAGADGAPVSLDVFTGPSPDSGMQFRVLLTKATNMDGFHPTEVLFESQVLDVAASAERRIDRYTVPMEGVYLESGRDYAWLLEFVPPVSIPAFLSSITGLGSYADGFAFRLPNGPFPVGGSREDIFASNDWFIEPFTDYAFQLSFIPLDRPVLLPGQKGDGLSLSWKGPWLLQRSADLLDWEDVPGASSPYMVPIDAKPHAFWRLRSP